MRAVVEGPILIARVADAGCGRYEQGGAAGDQSLGRRPAGRDHAFAKTVSVDFARAAWNFVARPVRASDAMCLQCHHEPVPGVRGQVLKARPVPEAIEVNALKIGDPLGVVIYGFRKTP